MKSKLELPQRANVNLFSLIFVIRITDFARKEGLLVVYTQVGFLCPVFPGKSEFRILVFVEGGKPEDSETNFWSKDHNKQQASLTCDTRSRN